MQRNEDDLLGRCPSCGGCIAFVDHEMRFCEFCGQELPISMRFKSAMNEIELDERIVGLKQVPCEEFHLMLIRGNKGEEKIKEEFGLEYTVPLSNFCPYCGKKITEESPKNS